MHRCLGLPVVRRLPKQLSVTARPLSSCTRNLNSGNDLPWFMREETTSNKTTEPLAYGSAHTSKPSLPDNLPEYLTTLHRHLSQSPLLAPYTLRICKPNSIKARITADDLALPYSRARGRRKRGIHDAGDSVGEPDDMWSWYVIAEVKEGTEGRGAIETVIRNAQRELLGTYPQLPIPRKLSRKRTSDGWEVLDLGDSLLHVVSREKSQKLFGDQIQGSSSL